MGSISALNTFNAEKNLCTNCHFDEQLCLFLVIQLYCPRTKEFIISDVTMTEFHPFPLHENDSQDRKRAPPRLPDGARPSEGCVLRRLASDFNQVVLITSHVEFPHVGELTQTAARFDALDQVVAFLFGERIDQVDRRLVDRENVGRGENPDVVGRRFRGARAGAVAVDRHAAHDGEIGDVPAEMIRHGLAAFDHAFHEVRSARPVVVSFAVQFALAARTRGATDRDVFEASAEAAHRVALKVRQNDHRVVVEKVLADVDFLEPLAALDRQRNVALFVHDVDGREGPAVRLEDLAVTGRRLTGTRIEDVALHDRGGHFRLEGLHPFARNDVGTVRFARMELQGRAARDVAVDELVEFQKSRRAQVLREVDLGAPVGGGAPRSGRFGGLERRRLQTSRHGRDGGEEITTTQHDFFSL